ncbi:MAG: SDR family NAD(P)-dependent oxidoreductase [Alysiella sp.]|uniref:SDR family NAD(P)-dependent oxidoreductase n=1 Tax=Alysiella sp. TaxID=1872483 RepID=UPI0026DAC312|nr:SDR family NAD(P)-dependent oxidoreductase [Alysiella sp.]MDO4433394.1 SDR family NAD(P)-dependent oxidoreductase [Alysiella sp.]
MNKTVLITGSNRGIGKAIALALAQDGLDIVLHCRSRIGEAEMVAAEIRDLGRQVRVLQFDVANRAACREILTADVAEHGAYYGVVLNAGLTRDNAFPALEDEDWDSMLAGGGEEFCPSQVYVFDSLYAASRRNTEPELTPRPYDKNRDGLVIGEGAGILVLESLEHAQARGAKIHAEIVGYGANSDGSHVTQPQKDTMQRCMELALKDAGICAEQVGYVNGHGTATEKGDIAETQAAADVFGFVPMSSQKSYFGHTLGACGALESWFSIEMMRDAWFAPTLNLTHIDENCGHVDFICGNAGRNIQTDYVVNNNFAFGGVNTSLIFKRWQGE